MLRKIFIANLLFFFLTINAFASIIKNVKVFGNKRITKESIIVFGKINLGKNYKQSELNNVLKNIYESNFFKDVNIKVNNTTLEITVLENPIIEDIQINGLRSKKLSEVLREQFFLKSRMSYVETKFVSDLNNVKNILKASGYFFSEVKIDSLLNEDQNTIQLIYNINLGDKAKISEIEFVGDKKFKDKRLRNIITSDISRFWKIVSQSIYLNTERVERDKRLLVNFYRNNGYYTANVTNSFVEFKDDNSFKLIFSIEAGNKYTFNEMEIILSEDYDPKYFVNINKDLNKLKNKEYSFEKIEKVLREVDKIALSKQYEFIDATLSETIVQDNKLNIQITLVDTEKFYIEKINILGNDFTIEDVIRDSFIVDEGDPYNEILFNKSINAIKSKNIFKTVETTLNPGSNENLKIIDLIVEEKPTGEISLGAGVGTQGGTIGGGIKENNFMGKGINLDTNLQFSQDQIRGKFSYKKENFNNSDNTLFTSLNSTSTDKLSDFGYKSSEIGGSIGTSFQQYENLYFSPEISTAYEKLTTSSLASENLKKQKGNYFDTYFNYSFNYDLRNKRYKADEGYNTYFYQELPMISKNQEIVNFFEISRYQKISESITKISFSSKAVNTISSKDVRLSKRLYIPSKKLRGFEQGKVGPIKNGEYLGGNYISTLNFNATLPKLLPSFQNTDISYFIDTANVWGVDHDSSINDNSQIRASTGVALDILTPIGPLNFSLSQPLMKHSNDITETFRFNLGTAF
ncbi:outer membrane protein assembly factor BamA [Candidatus Pelagibacter sp. Uisw_134_02]|uniref:outer membrane protein assembly factor BamA n=1 Tax=Candidatus Pelagibacter sp. Uisw_134_02 TaxID=3230990 RepID=UPI0039ECD54C